MYNRSGNYASGFWIVAGGIIIGLLLVLGMDWSVPDENIFTKYQTYQEIEGR